MKNIYLVISIIMISLSFALDAQPHENAIEINVIEQDMDHVIINYKINYYNINNIDINQEIYQQIKLDGEPNFIIENAPELPHINRSLIIPDNASISVEISEDNMTIFENMNILPSKGNIPRNIDITTIPYVEGDKYEVDDFFLKI